MSELISRLSPVKLAFAAQKARAKLDLVMAEPIAIVGMSCRFPGACDDPESFWELLLSGRDAVSEVPRERWDVERYYDPTPGTPGKMYTRSGAFLRGVDQFDPRFFGIAPREAQHMDPQQRLLLEVSWEALERAAVAPAALGETKSGIFVGVMHQDYAQLTRALDQIDTHTASGNGNSVLSGRLAHILGTQGPALTIDTACSSSLVAVHLACQSLRNHECELALAGGVNLILSPVTTIVECSSRMLAPDGRCKTFDAAADGFGRGEGCGVVVLKRLSDAVADGDRIVALIRGSAVNHDGHSSGIMVPNGKSQAKVIRDALANGGVDAAQVGFVEAHGTGTALGDPIEIQALRGVFGARTKDDPLVVGAVKSNIGHTEGAAGIAGLIKAALALQHRQIPPNVHFHNPSPRIEWESTPVRIPTEPLPWNADGGRRIAGVSSFGYSGTNAHVVLEEAPELESQATANERPLHALALSAKSEEALAELTDRYASHLQSHPDLPIGDVCFTANNGRSHFAHRLCVIAGSTAELRQKLLAGRGAHKVDGVFRGTAARRPMEAVSDRHDIATLASRYVNGATIDWAAVSRGNPIVLPTYPFQRQRCWVDLPDSVTRESRSVHPLLGVRIDLAGSDEIRFESEISRRQPRFLEDHTVFGMTVVPAAFYAEAAVAAGRVAFGERPFVVEDLTLRSAWVLRDGEGHRMQTVVKDGSLRIFTATDATWTERAAGRLSASDPKRERVRLNILPEEIDVNAYYENFRRGGLDYGPTFRAISELHRREGEALARIELKNAIDPVEGYNLHPVLLDAGFHAVGASLPFDEEAKPWIPVRFKRIEMLRPLPERLWCSIHTNVPADRGHALTADLTFVTEDGEVVARVEGFTARQMNRETFTATGQPVEPWLYRVEWRPQVRDEEPLPPRFPAVQRIDAAVAPLLAELESRPDLAEYSAFLEQLGTSSLRYVTEAFTQMQFPFAIGERFTTAALAQRLGVVPRYTRLFHRLLQMLAEEGIVKGHDEAWEVTTPPPRAGAMPHSENAEQMLLDRCASRLADVLRGSEDPLQLLFPNGDASLATRLYEHSPGTRALNSVAAAALREAIEHLPAGRGLRVIEIGAGTGGTTAHLLPVLPPARTRYLFTDISPLFVNQAQTKFRDFAFVDYAALDIEQSPEGQGFGTFDVVIAANVLHATSDLRRTLSNVRRLVAPGGLLLLLEATVRERWADLTFGLTDGWWKFSDLDIRPDHPLLPERRWEELLREARFEEAIGLGSNSGRSKAAVIVARTSDDAPVEASRRWLIHADAHGNGATVAELLRSRGHHCTVIDGHEPGAIANSSFDAIVHLRSLDAPPAETMTTDDLRAAIDRGCIDALHLVQAVAMRGGKPPDLWLVTRGAQRVGADAAVPGLGQSALWGMSKVIAQEFPAMRCVTVDLDPNTAGPDELLAELLTQSAEPEVAFRGGARFVSRLVGDRSIPKPASFDTAASYLIAGGHGGLGLAVARWMVERGARNLILMGRRPPGETARAAIAEMESLGAAVTVVQADVSNEAGVARVIAAAPSLRGIIHAAGVLDDGILLHQNRDRFFKVIDPKVIGTWNLHRATRNRALDFFVLFSSTASLLGNPGQANHAAANAFEDAFANALSASGRAALSINWGVWSDIGSATDPEVAARMRARGVGVIPTPDGLAALERVIAQRGQVAVVPIDWSQFRSGSVPPFLGELASSASRAETFPAADLEALRRLSESNPAECRTMLIDAFRPHLAAILGIAGAQQIDPKQSLHELGLDSLLAIELRNRISANFRIDVPIEALVAGVTAEELAQLILERLQIVSLTTAEPADSEIEEIAL